MPQFSRRSEEKLQTVNPILQRIVRSAIKITDFSVDGGWRDKDTQNKKVEQKLSKVSWPNSKHNRSRLDKINGIWQWDYTKADAVDLVPYKPMWPDIRTQTTERYAYALSRFYYLAGIIKGIALETGVEVIWGGDFKSFFDGPHFELVYKQ